MEKKLAKKMIAAGIVCVFASLSLFVYNTSESLRAKRFSEEIVADLQNISYYDTSHVDTDKDKNTCDIAGGNSEKSHDNKSDEKFAAVPQDAFKSVIIGSYEFIGYISVPSLGLDLPVISQWSYENLNLSPCRYSGSPLTDDLVIAAHNYSSHFGSISSLNIGDTVSFTDVEGIKTDYRAVLIDTLSPTDVKEMTAGQYDLTLFTCTYTGQARVTVRLNRV